MSTENEDYRSNFGFRLKSARKEVQLSQSGLADMTGMARDTISRYERGDLVPSVEVLSKILIALDSVSEEPFDANWLLSGLGKSESKKHVVDGIGTVCAINFMNGGSADISMGAGDIARILKACQEVLKSKDYQNEIVEEALIDLIEFLYSTEDGTIEIMARAFIANKSVKLTPSREILVPSTLNEDEVPLKEATLKQRTRVNQNFNAEVGQVGGGDIHNYSKKDK